MRIAVNMRFVIPGKLEGIGWYSFEVATRMARMHPEHQFIFLFDRTVDAGAFRAPNIEVYSIAPPARHPLLWYFWFEMALPAALKRYKADLFFSPDGFCSLRSNIPTLMVVHDLAFEHYPDFVPALVSRYYRHFSPRYAKRAERIVAVSQASSADLQFSYHIPAEKISVVYNGANERYSPLSPDEKVRARQRFGEGHDYFIYVGSVHPRKNLVRLLQAFDQFAHSVADQRLLIAGRMAWQSGPVQQLLKGLVHRPRIQFAGHLEPEELQLALGGATALLYPSLFEGFGIPILEAFRAAVPVMTSNRSSMPEVAGNAALLVNPEDIEEMAGAMLRLSREENLRQKLIADGLEQALRFSWDQCASQTWQALEKVLQRT